jgi:hypothetical protein
MKTWVGADTTCGQKHPGAHLIYLHGRLKEFVDDLDDIDTDTEYFIGASKSGRKWFWGNGIEVTLHISGRHEFPVLKQWEFKVYTVDKHHTSNFICEFNGMPTVGK